VIDALDTVAARVPVDPDRGQARQWALDELSRREYQDAKPSLIERALTWLQERLANLRFGDAPSLKIGLTVAALVVAAVVAYAVYRAGGFGRTARRASVAVLTDTPVSAADHRAAADRHAAAGEWDGAVRERFRAIARELEERAVLTPQPGRTALELATGAGRELPALRAELLSGARLFDDVSYGAVPMHERDDASLRALDTHLRAANLVQHRE
jgi:Domain of unknown function (DUF4129)